MQVKDFYGSSEMQQCLALYTCEHVCVCVSVLTDAWQVQGNSDPRHNSLLLPLLLLLLTTTNAACNCQTMAVGGRGGGAVECSWDRC